jgi:hypothetical protein
VYYFISSFCVTTIIFEINSQNNIKYMLYLFKEANTFYPQYLKAHSDIGNRILHFIGATQFFILIILGIIFKIWLFIPVAIFIAYLLPGIGHRFLQHNDSFRSTKPILCVICAARMYVDTLFFQISAKMKLYAN